MKRDFMIAHVVYASDWMMQKFNFSAISSLPNYHDVILTGVSIFQTLIGILKQHPPYLIFFPQPHLF